MAIEEILNGDRALEVRTKINNNFRAVSVIISKEKPNHACTWWKVVDEHTPPPPEPMEIEKISLKTVPYDPTEKYHVKLETGEIKTLDNVRR